MVKHLVVNPEIHQEIMRLKIEFKYKNVNILLTDMISAFLKEKEVKNA